MNDTESPDRGAVARLLLSAALILSFGFAAAVFARGWFLPWLGPPLLYCATFSILTLANVYLSSEGLIPAIRGDLVSFLACLVVGAWARLVALHWAVVLLLPLLVAAVYAGAYCLLREVTPREDS